LGPVIPASVPVSTALRVPAKDSNAIDAVVMPSIGGPSTQFEFYIDYTPPNVPTEAQVIIDGTAYTMQPKVPYSKPKGEIYNYSTNLSVGTHEFTFRFVGDGSTFVLPINDAPFSVRVAPFDVEDLTRIPLLFPSQAATFVARYTSPSGTAPTKAEVQLDGTSHPMTTNGTDFEEGVDYTFETTLAVGEHYFTFDFSDGTGGDVSFRPGATVTVMSLQLRNGSVSPAQGTTSTVFAFETTYYNSSGLNPTSALVYLGGKSHTMTYVSGGVQTGAIYRAEMTLPAGDHEYFFVFSDGQTTCADPFFPGSLNGPSVS
jgi:hypothetical protein